ncbi:MAG: hypothetical protein JW839_01060 [Candidatus Lokiarchaeota archaeon]|nr:hypothetical protein [Candidatus Lokiarchaeota archaeon]
MNSLIIYAINEKELLAAPLKDYFQPRRPDCDWAKKNPEEFSFTANAVDFITRLLPEGITQESGIVGNLGTFDSICQLAQGGKEGYIRDFLMTYITSESPYIIASEEQEGSAGILTMELEPYASPEHVRWFGQMPHMPFKTIVARKDFVFFIGEASKLLDRLKDHIASSDEPSFVVDILDECKPLFSFIQKMAKNDDIGYLIIDTC